MNIRKALIVLVIMLVGGAVFAAAIPDGSTLTLYDSTNSVVGTGSYVGGNLNLVVLDTATTGTYTLAVTNQGGHTMTYTVNLTMDTQTDSNGNVTGATASLTVGGVPLDEINPSILARGGDVSVTTTSGSLPSPGTVIHEPNDHANAHATESHDNSPDVPGTGATNRGDHGSHDSSTGGQVGSD
jgi:hypothetical protein